jgi:nucleoside-diphosphate-sugar epimerase
MPAVGPSDGPVAVTGVSGYTGGHLVRHLVHHGYTVRACLRDATSWRGADAVRYLEPLPGVSIVSGCDLFIPGSFDDAFAGCTAVFHVAAVLGNSAQEGAQPNASGDRGR